MVLGVRSSASYIYRTRQHSGSPSGFQERAALYAPRSFGLSLPRAITEIGSSRARAIVIGHSQSCFLITPPPSPAQTQLYARLPPRAANEEGRRRKTERRRGEKVAASERQTQVFVIYIYTHSVLGGWLASTGGYEAALFAFYCLI